MKLLNTWENKDFKAKDYDNLILNYNNKTWVMCGLPIITFGLRKAFWDKRDFQLFTNPSTTSPWTIRTK